MDMCAWGKNESDKTSLKWFSALKTYCYENDPSYMINWLYGQICQKINRELPLHCWWSPPFWSCLVTCVRRCLSQGITKGILKYAFATDQVILSDKKLALISWRLSGCRIDPGLWLKHILPTSKRAGTFSAKFICWVVLFLSLIGLWSSICFEWKTKLVHCPNSSFSLGRQTFYPQALSQTKSGSLFRKSFVKNIGSYCKNGIMVLSLPEFHIVWSSLKYTA